MGLERCLTLSYEHLTMVRLVIILLAALIYSTQSSALLGAPRIVLGGSASLKPVLFKMRSGEQPVVCQDGNPAAYMAVSNGVSAGDKGSQIDNLLGWYTYQLEKRPTTTKVVTSGIIAAVGDILSQVLLTPGAVLDFRRVAVFGTIGALYFAPVIDAWFTFLGKLPIPRDWSDTARAAAMTLVDQTVGAVIITSGFFYAFEAVQRAFPPYSIHTEGFLETATRNLRNNLFSTIQASWCCWPVINFLNFKFVPAPYRVLVSNVAAVFWNMYLAVMASSM